MKKVKTASFLTLLLAFCIQGTAFVADGYKVGDEVQDFSLKGIDGKMVSLGSQKDVKGYIIAFTCNTCPVAKAYEDRIIALNEKYAPKGYPVLAIQPNDVNSSPGDSFQAMQQRAKSKGYTFPYLSDETQNITRAFGATNTPHMFVVRKDGDKFKVAYIGAIDNNQGDPQAASQRYVENAVSELLAGKTAVTTPSARAVGCGIKWKNA
jgi:peroxiredoxin